MISKRVKFVVNPKSVPSIRDVIKASNAGQYIGEKQFVIFCKNTMEWGHPYNLKLGAKYKAHWNDNPRAWHKVR